MNFKFEKITVELSYEEAREIAFSLLHDLKNTVNAHWKYRIKEGCVEGFVAVILREEKEKLAILDNFSKIINCELVKDFEYDVRKVYGEMKKESEA